MINKPVDLIFTYLLSYLLYAYKVIGLVPVINTVFNYHRRKCIGARGDQVDVVTSRQWIVCV